jgi:DinB superfamily
MASHCFLPGRIEAAVRYADAAQQVIASRRYEVPFGLDAGLGVAYVVIGQPERREDTGRNQESGSVIEYVCHLRDVYITYTIRLHRTRTEDRPTLEPMFNDLRARRFRYNERDVETVIDELASATAGFCDEVACNSGDDWDRTASRLPGEQRTALWLVRQAMHEGVHHLGDIRRISDSGPA